MLESMRNHAQSWLSKVILGGIILSFALWGVGDYFMGSRVQVVAEVDGEPMADSTFQQVYERQINIYRAALGGGFSREAVARLGLKQKTVQTMINRRLMLSEAAAMGLVAPEATLLARVHAEPVFQAAGSFDANRYRILTRNMGFRTPADYENEQRQNLMINALQRAIIESAEASEEEVRQRFADDYEKRVIAAIIVDPSSLKSKISVTDEQARAYYEAHKDSYRSPLRLKLAVVEINPKAIAADLEISEDDIRAAYAERQDTFTIPEQRHARHILIRLPKNADEKTVEAAREKIRKVAARIKAGEDFVKVAKEMSDDHTAKNGGDLGFFERGRMVAPFDKAVFSMQAGEISGAVRTQFGLHLIQLLEIRPEKLKTFEEVRDELADQLRLSKAKDEAYKLSQDLDDALGQEDTLRAAAESMNLPVREIGPLSQDEALAEPLFAGNPALRQKAFAAAAGDPVEVVELDDGRFVAVEVLQRLESETLPFAKVTKKVYAQAKKERAAERARKKAEDIRLKAEHTRLETLAQKYGQPIYISKPVRRIGSGDLATWLTTEVLQAAFDTAKGKMYGKVIEVPQGLAIIQVRDVIAASQKDFSKQRKAIRSELLKANGAVRFARWIFSVRQRHDIVVHDDVLDRF